MESTGLVAIAAALAIGLSTIGPGIGEGIAASKALEVWLVSPKSSVTSVQICSFPSL